MHARIWLAVSFASAVAVVLGTSPERPLRAQSTRPTLPPSPASCRRPKKARWKACSCR